MSEKDFLGDSMSTYYFFLAEISIKKTKHEMSFESQDNNNRRIRIKNILMSQP